MAAASDRSTPGSRRLCRAALLVVALLYAGTTVAAGPHYKGRSLVEAIATLEATGLVIYYSSDLIRPWMSVKTEPAAAEPKDVLAEILEPYDLALREGPYGSLIVTRTDRTTDKAQPGAILGIVRETPLRRSPGRCLTPTGISRNAMTWPQPNPPSCES